MKKVIMLLAVSTLIVGCTDGFETKYPKYEVDRAKQEEIFNTCMKNLPTGPQSTKYNDWDEVVNQCELSARNIALYCYENCPAKRGELP